MEPAEPMGEETRVLTVTTGKGTSKGTQIFPVPTSEGTSEAATTASIEPIVIIL